MKPIQFYQLDDHQGFFDPQSGHRLHKLDDDRAQSVDDPKVILEFNAVDQVFEIEGND